MTRRDGAGRTRRPILRCRYRLPCAAAGEDGPGNGLRDGQRRAERMHVAPGDPRSPGLLPCLSTVAGIRPACRTMSGRSLRRCRKSMAIMGGRRSGRGGGSPTRSSNSRAAKGRPESPLPSSTVRHPEQSAWVGQCEAAMGQTCRGSQAPPAGGHALPHPARLRACCRPTRLDGCSDALEHGRAGRAAATRAGMADAAHAGAFAAKLEAERGWHLEVPRHSDRQLWRYGLKKELENAFHVLPRRLDDG